MGSLEEILAGYDGLQAGQEAFYKDLHRHPELSHQEHRTAERVAGQLQAVWLHGPDRHRRHGRGRRPGQRRRAHRAAAGRTGRAAGQGGHRRGLREHRDRQGRRRPRGTGGPRLRPRHAHVLPARHGQAHGRSPRPVERDPARRCSSPPRRPATAPRAWSTTACSSASPSPTWPWPSICCPGIAGTVADPFRARSCRPQTASRSPCTGGAATAPCRRTPSTRWCSRP